MSGRGEPTFARAKTARSDAEQMHVAAVFHRYPPAHGAGAEWMAHSLFRDLVARGHHVTVFCSHGVTTVGDFEGVQVRRWSGGTPQLVGHDVVVTHLDRTRDAVWAARSVGLPLVHLVHNHRQLRHHRVQPADADLVVFNSEWIAARYLGWPGPTAVIRPPVDVDQYAVGTHTDDRVTLVNLSEAKGGDLFWRLAYELRHRDFLGVTGAYAHQLAARSAPNVELIPNTADMAHDVYARTKILLMPSSYESWGRVGIEAACSGIPTIAAPTEGLVESLGSAAFFAEREDVGRWVERIERLFTDADEYERASAAAYVRARELDPKLGDYDRWEELLLGVVRGHVRAS